MGKIVLFDIDQTLLLAGRAGSTAMAETFEELYGVSDAFKGVRFAGRTDPAILRDAFRNSSIVVGDEREFAGTLERFKAIYYEKLASALSRADGARLLPGVVPLLDALRDRSDVYLGLATGNFRQGAMMKLGHFGIAGYFIDGGFGDDAEDRAAMVAVAAQRIAISEAVPAGSHQVFVFGDTPHDIQAATANGHVGVGVATGSSSTSELAASGAHHVFENLADLGAVLAALELPAV